MEKKGHLRQSTLKGKNFTFFNLLFWKDRKRKRKKFGKERERERGKTLPTSTSEEKV